MYFLKNGGNVINAFDFLFQGIVPAPVLCLLSLFIKPILHSLRVVKIFTVVAYLHNIHCWREIHIVKRLEQYHSFSFVHDSLSQVDSGVSVYSFPFKLSPPT